MKVINISKRFKHKQVNSYDADKYREIFNLHIAIQAEDDQDREWLIDESACWKKVSAVADPSAFYSAELDILQTEALLDITAEKISGYVLNDSLLEATNNPDIFVFSEVFAATPAVLGILTELDMIRWSGQPFPGNVVPKSIIILDLLKALENFTY